MERKERRIFYSGSGQILIFSARLFLKSISLFKDASKRETKPSQWDYQPPLSVYLQSFRAQFSSVGSLTKAAYFGEKHVLRQGTAGFTTRMK